MLQDRKWPLGVECETQRNVGAVDKLQRAHGHTLL